MTAATIGKWAVTTDGAPLEEVLSVSGLGKTNDTVEVTNFDSPVGTKEYIAGLAEGSEISIECNYLPAATAQVALVASVDAGGTVAVVMTYATTASTYTFSGVAQGWSVTPATSEQNKISFTLKISGDIAIT